MNNNVLHGKKKNYWLQLHIKLLYPIIYKLVNHTVAINLKLNIVLKTNVES